MKAVGQRALKEGLGVDQDVLNGQKLGDSVMKRGKKAIGSLTTQNASQAQKGGGRKPIKRKAKPKSATRAPVKRRKTSPPKKNPRSNQFNNFF